MQQLLRNIRSIRLVLFYDLSSEWRHFLLRADIVGGEIEFFARGRTYRAVITKMEIVQHGVRIDYESAKVYGSAGWGDLDPGLDKPGDHIWVNVAYCKPQDISGQILLKIPLAEAVIFPVGTSRKPNHPVR